MSDPATPFRRVIFVHVPKAAGTTFFRALDRLFSGSTHTVRVATQGDIPDEELPADAAVLRGAIPYGAHERLPGSTAYVTILRDPVDRVISHYFHVKETPTHVLHDRVHREGVELERFVREFEWQNLQTRLVSGLLRTPPGTEDLDLAKRNLAEGFAVVGVTKRFEEFCVLCKITLGWERWPYYRTANVGQSRPRLEHVSDETRATILEHNAFDAELFAYAQELFEERVASLGPRFDRELRRFRLGQRVFERRHRIGDAVKPASRALRRQRGRAVRVGRRARRKVVRLGRRGKRLVRRVLSPKPPGAAADELVVFVHVHKAAGTTLVGTFNRLFGKDAVHVHQELEGPAAIAKAVEPGTKVVRAPYGLGLHTHVDRPVRYITVLREPMQRAVSAYLYWCRRHGIEPDLEDLEAEHGLYRFVTEDQEPLFTDNGQTRVIGGCWDVPAGELTTDMLEQAKRNLERFTVVGTTDRFDEFLVACRTELGWRRQPLYRTTNVAENRRSPESLRSEIAEAIREHNRLDAHLYPAAVAAFEAHVARLGPRFERDLASFRARQRDFEARLAGAGTRSD